MSKRPQRLRLFHPTALRPWLQVVETARQRYDEQRWRLAAIEGLSGWREFAVAWGGCAFLREHGKKHLAPADLLTDDDLMAWAWDVVEPRTSEAIEVAVSRSNLDGMTAVACFDAMQGSGLIFPDGEVSRRVMDRISREVMGREIEQTLALSRANQELREIQAKQITKTP